MIFVTRLNRTEFVINADLIENVEATPDTVITLTTGKKLVVTESPQVIIERVVAYKQRCYRRFNDAAQIDREPD